MSRKNERLVVLLDKDEAAIVNALAEHERLPLSTMTRRLLLDEAERRRLLPLPRADRQRAEEMAHATQ